jgi:uncharacterized membrane protein
MCYLENKSDRWKIAVEVRSIALKVKNTKTASKMCCWSACKHVIFSAIQVSFLGKKLGWIPYDILQSLIIFVV